MEPWPAPAMGHAALARGHARQRHGRLANRAREQGAEDGIDAPSLAQRATQTFQRPLPAAVQRIDFGRGPPWLWRRAVVPTLIDEVLQYAASKWWTDVEQTRRLTLRSRDGILRALFPIPHLTLAVVQASSDRAAELAGWLSRTALGDRAAFAALYRATSAHLFGVVLRINRDRSQAEELLQDIYVNIWRAAGGFDGARAQPMTWLVSIARNRAIDSLRRAKTDVKTVSRSAPGADGEEDLDLLAALPSDAAGPLQLLERAADARALTHCVRQLSAEQQQCVALAYYQGLSHAEVAEHLTQPLGTVKSWVRRALAALKSCLARSVDTAARTPAGGA